MVSPARPGSVRRVSHQHPWAAIPPGMPLLECNLCGASIPMNATAQTSHLRHHAQLNALQAAVADALRGRKAEGE